MNRQYGAIPYRRAASGAIEIMLITSRETGRWIIPKGWPMPDLSPSGSAAQEAVEESGVIGQIAERPIGSYVYDKRQRDGSVIPLTVDVFPLQVEDQLPSWPEQAQRSTRWFSLQEAAESVQEPGLKAIIGELASVLD